MADLDFLRILKEGGEGLGLRLSDLQLKQFSLYKDLVLLWNARLNLTSLTDESDIAILHFLDSLSGLSIGIPQYAELIDVGTGAGFPGFPLKIARPDLSVVLVESTTKKATFLRHVVEELGLEKVDVLSERAEVLGQNVAFRERFDIAAVRAVAALPVIMEYALPFLRPGGVFIAYKGALGSEEIQSAGIAAASLGGLIEEIAHPVIPFLKVKRSLVLVRKEAPTDKKYPRRAGIPKKRPLGAER